MPEHRSFLVIDAEDSSGRPDPQLVELRSVLYELVGTALDRIGVSGADVSSEDRGDGVLLLLAGSVPTHLLTGPFVEQLDRALRDHNGRAELDDWLRLRIAVGHGAVHPDGHGWSGAALTATFRLANAPVVKQVLRDAGRARCVVVCSDELFRAVVRHGYPGNDPETYRQAPATAGTDEQKPWIRVPGYRRPPVPEAPAVPGRPAVPAGGPTTVFHDRVDIGRDLNIGTH